MSLAFSSIVSSIDASYGDKSRGAFTQAKVLEYVNSEARLARVFFDLPTSEYIYQLPIWNGVYTYQLPAGYKGYVSLLNNFFISDEADVIFVPTDRFWSDVSFRNIAAEQWQGVNRQLLVKLQTPNLGNYSLTTMDTFNGNGTWTAFGDASGVQTNQQYVHNGSGSVSFNLTYATGTGGIVNSTLQAIDLSGLNIKQIGTLFAWLFLPSFTGYTSVQVQFGSSATNYYQQTATTAQGAVPFVAGWQQLGWPWSSATTVGAPNASAINFLRFTFNFPSSMPAQTAVCIDDIWMRQQLLMNLTFVSDYLVTDTSSVLHDEFADFNTSSAWTFNIPSAFKDWLVFRVLKRAFVFVKPTAMSVQELEMELQRIEQELYTAYPSRRHLPEDNYYETTEENPVPDTITGTNLFWQGSTSNPADWN